jgi:aspartate-semialdehyde dehydrogenase
MTTALSFWTRSTVPSSTTGSKRHQNLCGGELHGQPHAHGLSGLFAGNHIEWISAMTYQAASGAGAKNMKELIAQMGILGMVAKDLVNDPESSAIVVDEMTTAAMRSTSFPTENFMAPLAGSLLPWIDVPMESGQTREEWKGLLETNKILRIENTHSHRRALRAGGGHALPQPGAYHQTEQRHPVK